MSWMSQVLSGSTRTLPTEGYDFAQGEFRYAADLRYVGQAYELTVPARHLVLDELVELFHREHERTYGHRSHKDTVHLVNARLTVRLPVVLPQQQFAPTLQQKRVDRRVCFASTDDVRSVAVIGRGDLDAAPRQGPFIIEEYDCTCVVAPGQTARLDEIGNIDIALEAA